LSSAIQATLVKAKRLFDRKARGAEWAKIVEEYRHRESGCAIRADRIPLPGGKYIFKIEKARKLPFFFSTACVK
jgi:hypothetical protein